MRKYFYCRLIYCFSYLLLPCAYAEGPTSFEDIVQEYDKQDKLVLEESDHVLPKESANQAMDRAFKMHWDQSLKLNYLASEKLYLEIDKQFGKTLAPEDDEGNSETYGNLIKNILPIVRCKINSGLSRFYKDEKIFVDKIINAIQESNQKQIEATLSCDTSYGPYESETYLAKIPELRAKELIKVGPFKFVKKQMESNSIFLAFSQKDGRFIVIHVRKSPHGWIWDEIFETADWKYVIQMESKASR